MKTSIVIVGGGITGLTVAYRLSALKNTHHLAADIILLEGSERLGGVIKSESTDNFVIEHGPDAFLADQPEMKNLLADLDLTNELLPTNTNNRRAFIANNENLIPLPSGFYLIAPSNLWSFLGSPLFSLFGKLRVLLEILLPAQKNVTKDESVATFIRRRFGNELLTQAAQPLLSSIYMADLNLLSAQASISYFLSLEQEHGSVIKGLLSTYAHQANTASGARYNLFTSLTGGIETLVKRLSERLTNVQINLKTVLQTISCGENKNWRLQTNNGLMFEADIVVFATPAKSTAPIVSQLDKNLGASLSRIENTSSAVVNLLYKKSDIGHNPAGFGFVVPKSENKKIIACGLISKKFAQRAFSDSEMVRVFIGGQSAPRLLDLSDDELKKLAHDQLAPYLRIKAAPQKIWLSRWPQGLPFYQINHYQTVQTIEKYAAKHNGLFFTGASYYGLGIPDCVRNAEATANKVLAFLQTDNLSVLLDNKERAKL